MKKLLSLLFALGLTLSACETAQTQVAPLAQTSTPTLTPTITQTPTATITPLPTIPTFTPTFDVRTIVTVTPAEKAECPKEDPSIKPDFKIPNSESCSRNGGTTEQCYPRGFGTLFLDFLNSGGTVNSLLKAYYFNREKTKAPFFYQDVTGDDSPELMLYDLSTYPSPNIYYCRDGKYKSYTIENYSLEFISFVGVFDLNKNNIPDIVFATKGCSGSGCFTLTVLEWNGRNFSDISSKIGINGLDQYSIKDLNNDGIKEIVLRGDIPGFCCTVEAIPWRYKTIVFSWDGAEFSESYMSFDQAKYRFQEVQDADREILYGNYEIAFGKYEKVIQDKNLDSWSKERQAYEVNLYYNSLAINATTPIDSLPPPPDPAEYPSLASYAYYRIMLLQFVQGQESEAASTYQTLQQTFGSDSYGRPYVEMATAFWDAYQSTHKMFDGCAAAIQYAVEHPELLTPLGSDYHGSQSHKYVPADVCPFR